MYQFSFDAVFQNFPDLLSGAGLTVLLTIVSTVFGLVIGVLGAVARAWKIRILYPIFTAYVELFRNTPFLVQLYFIFFGLPSLGVKFSGIEASILAMVLNLGAYSTEIIRAGVQSIPRGQLEAAEALALSRWQTLFYVILRPALKNVWPSLCSQVIVVMLGSAVCSQVAAEEIAYASNLIQARTFRVFEVYTVSTMMYLALAVAFRKALMLFGQRVIVRRPA